jgi:hypothetical protein
MTGRIAMNLICEECYSPELERHGAKSILDGRHGWRCLACGNLMGPVRSRTLLLILMVLAVGVTLVGLVFCVLSFSIDLSQLPIRRVQRVLLLLLVCSGSVIGPVTIFLLMKAYRQKQPRKVD